MTCPHCRKSLTEAQIKSIWASYTGKKQTPHAGPGRPKKKKPYRVDTYCGGCHDTRAHYLREDHSDDKRDCYECSQCLHLVFAPRGLEWYEK